MYILPCGRYKRLPIYEAAGEESLLAIRQIEQILSAASLSLHHSVRNKELRCCGGPWGALFGV